MRFMNNVFCLVYFFAAFAWSTDKFDFLHPIVHEMRFTKFKMTVNQSYGAVLEATVKQYYDKQVLDAHMFIGQPDTIYTMIVEFDKCQEHYIDCTNVRTFQVKNMCSNMKAFVYFLKVDYKSQEFLCELKGDYVYRNATFNMENYISLLTSPMTKWWELCYKWKFEFYNINNQMLLVINGENHFLTFRRRNRKP